MDALQLTLASIFLLWRGFLIGEKLPTLLGTRCLYCPSSEVTSEVFPSKFTSATSVSCTCIVVQTFLQLFSCWSYHSELQNRVRDLPIAGWLRDLVLKTHTNHPAAHTSSQGMASFSLNHIISGLCSFLLLFPVRKRRT